MHTQPRTDYSAVGNCKWTWSFALQMKSGRLGKEMFVEGELTKKATVHYEWVPECHNFAFFFFFSLTSQFLLHEFSTIVVDIPSLNSNSLHNFKYIYNLLFQCFFFVLNTL